MKKGEFILSIDQGTTGSTAALIDMTTFTICDMVEKDHQQYFPRPGWVEHDLDEIWQNIQLLMGTLVKKHSLDSSTLVGIGITNQRETLCAFNKEGSPSHRAIVWQDRRGEELCQKLRPDWEQKIKKITGLPIDPYFTASKIHYLANIEKIADQSLFGTIDTYLLYKLTGGESYATDASNASRTLLMDIEKNTWNDELITLFGVNKSSLPQIFDSTAVFGKTKGVQGVPDGIPIAGILGDQQAALLGQGATGHLDTKCTYGTGAFLLTNCGTERPHSNSGLLSTIFMKHQGVTTYALEGSCYIAGAAVQYLRDQFRFIRTAEEVASRVNKSSLQSTSELLFYPFFTGIATPYWKPTAKAAIIGMDRGTTQDDILRVCLEGVALSVVDLIHTLQQEQKVQLASLKVDGGMSLNETFLSIQSNFLHTPIIRPQIMETTVLGAGLACALGLGRIQLSDIKRLWKSDIQVNPTTDLNQRNYYQSKKILWNKVLHKLYV